MKIKGKITMLIDQDRTSIEIEDAEASVVLARIELTPEKLNSILSRLAFVDCEVNVGDLSKIGKKHENKEFEFEIPEEMNSHNPDVKALKAIADDLLEDGWEADSYFGRQNSFFTKDDKQYARVVIRRWV